MQVIKDWFLFVIVLLVVAVDLLIALIGTAIPSTRLNATLVADDEHQMTVDVSNVVYKLMLMQSHSMALRQMESPLTMMCSCA